MTLFMVVKIVSALGEEVCLVLNFKIELPISVNSCVLVNLYMPRVE